MLIIKGEKERFTFSSLGFGVPELPLNPVLTKPLEATHLNPPMQGLPGDVPGALDPTVPAQSQGWLGLRAPGTFFCIRTSFSREVTGKL